MRNRPAAVHGVVEFSKSGAHGVAPVDRRRGRGCALSALFVYGAHFDWVVVQLTPDNDYIAKESKK